MWSIPTYLSTGLYHLCPETDSYYKKTNKISINLLESADCPVLWASGTHGPCIGPTRTATNPTPTTTPSETSVATPTTPLSNPSKGTKAGIGIGVTLAVICAALGGWLVYKRRKKQVPGSGGGDNILASEQGIDAESHGKENSSTSVALVEDYGIDNGRSVEIQ